MDFLYHARITGPLCLLVIVLASMPAFGQTTDFSGELGREESRRQLGPEGWSLPFASVWRSGTRRLPRICAHRRRPDEGRYR